MSLLSLLREPPGEREETIEEDGVRLVLRGRPDANLFGRSLLLDPGERKLRARHWSGVCGVEFEPMLVPRVLLVRECLVGDHDEIDVARLACERGPLFLRLFASACRVCGLAPGAAAEPVIVEAASPK